MTISRVTPSSVAIIEVLLAANNSLWGLEISRLSGVKSSTVYLFLDRIAADGWLESEWGANSDQARRRLYWLTADGREGAIEFLRHASTRQARNQSFKLKLFSAK
jgi:DNA-binding PadR family transcriptional regulator